MNGGEDPCVNCEMRTYGEAPALSLNGGASYTTVGRKTPAREEMQHGLHLLQALNTNIGVAPESACVDCEHDQGMRGSLVVHPINHETPRRRVVGDVIPQPAVYASPSPTPYLQRLVRSFCVCLAASDGWS